MYKMVKLITSLMLLVYLISFISLYLFITNTKITIQYIYNYFSLFVVFIVSDDSKKMFP